MKYFLLILISSFFIASVEGFQYTDEVPEEHLSFFISATNKNKAIFESLKKNRIPPELKDYSPDQIDALRVYYYAPYLTGDKKKAQVAFRIRHPQYDQTPLLPNGHFLISQAYGILEVANFLGKRGYVKYGENVSSYREAVLNALRHKIIHKYFFSPSEEEQRIWQRMTLHAYIYLGIIEGDLGGYDLYEGEPLPLLNAWSHFCSAKSNAKASTSGTAKKCTQLYMAALLIKGYGVLGKTKEQAFEEAEMIWNAYNLPPSKRPRLSSKKERENIEEQNSDILMEEETPAEQNAYGEGVTLEKSEVKRSSFSVSNDAQFDGQIKVFIKDALTAWKDEHPEASEGPSTVFSGAEDDDHEGGATGGEGAGPDLTSNSDGAPPGDAVKPMDDSSKEGHKAGPMDDSSEDESAHKKRSGKSSKRKKIESDNEEEEENGEGEGSSFPHGSLSKDGKKSPKDASERREVRTFFETNKKIYNKRALR